MQPLDYTFEIFIIVGVIYGLIIAYIRYIKTNANVMDGEQLMKNYLYMEGVRCKRLKK